MTISDEKVEVCYCDFNFHFLHEYCHISINLSTFSMCSLEILYHFFGEIPVIICDIFMFEFSTLICSRSLYIHIMSFTHMICQDIYLPSVWRLISIDRRFLI